jgi:DNA-directed RNA polymerase subunit RPC12/RpoP
MVGHDKLVNQLKETIFSLGLFHLPLNRHLCRGFKPDIITMVGAQNDDIVYIDAINARDSLNRDIGALLKLKANLDDATIPYRMFLGVCNDSMEKKHLDDFEALIRRTHKFKLIYGSDLKEVLRKLMLESALEKVERGNQRNLEIYFHDACSRCGNPHVEFSHEHDGEKYICPKCGSEWLVSDKDFTEWLDQLNKKYG